MSTDPWIQGADNQGREPLVSVALCTYNGARHLERQLDSLLAQSHRHLEILAADDASTDGSAELLRRYAARDSRLSVLRQPVNLGFSANFASVLARCGGDFICPCDQDDVWHPDKIKRLLEVIGDRDLAYCDSAMIRADGSPLGRRLSQERGMVSGQDPLVFLLSNCASGHAMLFRRQLLNRAVPFPAGLYYDWWLAIAAAAGGGLRYLDEPLVQFRRHDATVTSLGGVRVSEGIGRREFLEERLLILSAMRRLDSSRQAAVIELEETLRLWLERGRGLPFLRSVWRYHRPLLVVLRPRLGRLLRLSLKYLSALGRRP